MKSFRHLAFLFAMILSTSGQGAEPTPSPKILTWADVSGMPLPAHGERISYGAVRQQFGELRIPQGDGPFPLIVLIHGGCWVNVFNYEYMTHLAAWFQRHGVATWTIEYRRLGDSGGGWPDTFLDAAEGTDFLREIAKTHPIDLKRVYAAGHSAGGQLALWLASRNKIAGTSDLFVEDPLPIRGVLGLAAITNLTEYRVGPEGSCHASVDPLLGGSPKDVASRYAETSPSQRLPLGKPQIFLQGENDPIVDPASVKAYVDAAKKAGDRAVIVPIPHAGHFEAAVPLSQNEPLFAEALRLLMQN